MNADPNVSQLIEQYLLAARGWVPAREIAEIFSVRERQLRQTYDQPGLCSRFAISSDAGLRHVSCATTAEWLHYKHRLRRHGISELVRVRDQGRLRSIMTRRSGSLTFERDTGQAILPLATSA